MPPSGASLPIDHDERMRRVRLAVDGLSLGDSFGQQFFSPSVCIRANSRTPPDPPWNYTDDTVMALAIAEVLGEFGRIEQDRLAAVFARRFDAEPTRGYGSGTMKLLHEVVQGGDWRQVSAALFGGVGSFGNGGAMRVAPVGAYFAADLARAAAEARASAEVTHGHVEGQAGAIAVAIAAAWAWNWQEAGRTEPRETMLRVAADFTPESQTRAGIIRAMDLPLECWEHEAANALGNGALISAPDTVPFCLWCAAAHLDDFQEAMWVALRVGGDIDTNCAIIGGIVALAVGRAGLPDDWLRCRESLWWAPA